MEMFMVSIIKLRKDKERQNFLESLGFVIYRYTNNDIKNNLIGVLNDLISKIKSSPLSSTTPSPSSSEEGDDTAAF